MIDAMGDILRPEHHMIELEALPHGQEITVAVPVVFRPDSRPRLNVLNISTQYILFSGEIESTIRAFTLGNTLVAQPVSV